MVGPAGTVRLESGIPPEVVDPLEEPVHVLVTRAARLLSSDGVRLAARSTPCVFPTMLIRVVDAQVDLSTARGVQRVVFPSAMRTSRFSHA